MNGLVTIPGNQDVDATSAAIQDKIREAGFNIVAVINHAASAANVDLELRPTQLIIFGNPNVGTKLMQSSQTTAIDLPQKILIWEDESGQTNISFNDPQYLAQRHAITGIDEVLGKIRGALGNFAEAGKAKPG